jgi:hypothetical protein
MDQACRQQHAVGAIGVSGVMLVCVWIYDWYGCGVWKSMDLQYQPLTCLHVFVTQYNKQSLILSFCNLFLC